MASEIRVNRLSNRSGLSTITFANGGVQFSGITTFANGDFRVGTGATILNPSTNEMQFHTGGSNRLTINNAGLNLGIGSITVGDATFTGSVSIGKTLTYEDVKNVDSLGIVTARTGVKVTGGDFTVGTAITASSVTGNVTNDVGITTYSGSAVWFKGATANKDMYWSHASGATIYKDNAQILMGDSSDLQLKHDGTNSILDNNTGDLILRCDSDDVKILAEDDIVLRDNDDSTNFIHCINGGAVELYHNGTKKFDTTSSGARVHDQLQVDGTIFAAVGLKVNADNQKIRLGASDDFEIYHDGTENVLGSSGLKNIVLKPKDTDVGLKVIGDGGCELYYDNGKKLETTSTGASISGLLAVSGSTSQTSTFTGNGVTIAHASGSNIFIGTQTGTDAKIQVTNNAALHFRTNNTERVRITAAGDVGIGYNSPTVKLHVREGASGFSGTYDNRYNIINESSGEAYLGFYVPDNQYAGIRFHDTTGCEAGIDYYYSSDSLQFWATDHQLFKTAGTERLRITSAGHLQLQGGTIYGDDGGTGTFILRNTSGNSNHARIEIGAIQSSDNGGIHFYTAGSSAATRYMTLKGGGNLGIGVDNPSTTVHLDSTGATTTLQIDSDTESSIDFNDHGGSAKRYKIGTNISDNSGQFEIKDMTANAGRLRIESDGAIKNIYVDEKRGIAPIYRDYCTLTTSWLTIARISGYANATMFRFTFEGQASGAFWNGYADIMVGHYRQYKIKLHNGGSIPVSVRLFGNGSGTCDLQVKAESGNSGTMGFNIIPSTFEADGTIVFTNTLTMSDSNLEIQGVLGTVSKSYQASSDDYKVWGSIQSGSVTEPAVLKVRSDGRVRYFEHYFNCSKGGSGNSHTVDQDLMTVTGLGSFHQAHFTADFGVRLQGQGDQYTRPALWQSGINRFNSASSFNINENWINGDSSVQTYANLHISGASSTSYRIRMEWASGTYGSSFASGRLSGYFVNDSVPRSNISFAYGNN